MADFWLVRLAGAQTTNSIESCATDQLQKEPKCRTFLQSQAVVHKTWRKKSALPLHKLREHSYQNRNYRYLFTVFPSENAQLQDSSLKTGFGVPTSKPSFGVGELLSSQWGHLETRVSPKNQRILNHECIPESTLIEGLLAYNPKANQSFLSLVGCGDARFREDNDPCYKNNKHSCFGKKMLGCEGKSS